MATTSSVAIQHQLRSLPSRPGVYIFRNTEGQVIYIGKATKLRDRVRSYFGSPVSFENRTRRLVEQIADLEYIVTASAQEALILEATLVKKHQPFFNVRLKDDKHYPYLKIDLREKWPRVEITRRVQRDGARYFGPYASPGSVRTSLDLVKKLFPWRSCTKVITGRDPRPCLDYHINRCIGPCASLCSEEDYRHVIRQVILFLEGRTDEIVGDLRARMETAAEAQEYESAARFRDQIRAIEQTTEQQVMTIREFVDIDVFGLARNGEDAFVEVFFIRKTKVVGHDCFALEGSQDADDQRILAAFLQQYYESATAVPRRILLPFPIVDQELIELWLSERRGGRVHLTVPLRGNKRALVKRAEENAQEALKLAQLRQMSDRDKAEQALYQLHEQLNLPAPPHRIECYDISNIQGTAAVGSMVVFVDGRPRSEEYRRFRIKTVRGIDDFAMMQEVLKRRFKRAQEWLNIHKREEGSSSSTSDASFGALPNLVIVDGGKGQLSAALDAMRNLGVGDIPITGLAKRFEELYVKDVSEPILLPRSSQALFLVQRIRDEAHRFAVTYHRKVRHKAAMNSPLDAVPGVGPKRKKALLRKFGSLSRLREANVDDIAATPGFTKRLAEKVLAVI